MLLRMFLLLYMHIIWYVQLKVKTARYIRDIYRIKYRKLRNDLQSLIIFRKTK